MKAEKLTTTGATVFGEPFNLISEESIKKCIEYSDAPGELRTLLGGLDITAALSQVAVDESWGDKKERACYKIAFSNGLTFDFWQSLNFKEILFSNPLEPESRISGRWIKRSDLGTMKKEEMNSFLYSVLCCVRSDSYTPELFEDFCCEYGYDSDSIKAETLHRECVKQARKIRKIFNAGQIDCLPQ